jgi:sigma-B regulation protein RsbU (phosphoserine phosphatase)
VDLPAGRDQFWLDLDGGTKPDDSWCAAAGIVLGSWLVREELKLARFAERRRLWEVESLRAIAEALGGTLDPARIAEELLMHATALLDARRGEVWLAAKGGAYAVSRVAGASQAVACETGDCLVAARLGGAVLSEEEAVALPDDGLLEASRLAVPVTGRRGRLAILALAEREIRGGTAPFGATDAETLVLFASQAAVALENATLHGESLEQERLEREIELAATVQRNLLPTSLPTTSGYELAARSEPSRRVGGDIYDLITTPRGLFVMLGDVAGKGVPAALMAASVQAAVRILMQHTPPLDQLASQLHQHLLVSTPVNKFATVFLAYLADDGTLEWLNGGHNPVVLADPEGGCQLLEPVGPPLGLLAQASYSTRRAFMADGAILLAYTDGLSEAAAPGDSGDEFGTARIASLVAAKRHDDIGTIVGDLFTAVEAFTAGAPAHDDRTVVAARRQRP